MSCASFKSVVLTHIHSPTLPNLQDLSKGIEFDNVKLKNVIIVNHKNIIK